MRSFSDSRATKRTGPAKRPLHLVITALALVLVLALVLTVPRYIFQEQDRRMSSNIQLTSSGINSDTGSIKQMGFEKKVSMLAAGKGANELFEQSISFETTDEKIDEVVKLARAGISELAEKDVVPTDIVDALARETLKLEDMSLVVNTKDPSEIVTKQNLTFIKGDAQVRLSLDPETGRLFSFLIQSADTRSGIRDVDLASMARGWGEYLGDFTLADSLPTDIAQAKQSNLHYSKGRIDLTYEVVFGKSGGVLGLFPESDIGGYYTTDPRSTIEPSIGPR